jgi:hypothetical protein
MRLRFCEGRSAVSEHVISVESDSETLGRAGCEREKAGRRCGVGLPGSDYRIRHRDRDYLDKLSS